MRPYLEEKMRRVASQIATPLVSDINSIRQTVGVDELPIDARILAIISPALDKLSGVNGYLNLADTKQSMRNENLRLRAIVADSDIALLKDAVAALSDESAIQNRLINAIINKQSTTADSILSIQAQLEIQRANALATQSDVQLTQSEVTSALLRISALESQSLADSNAELAKQAHEQRQDAQLALLAAQAKIDEAAIAAAQQRLDRAQATADNAINAAAAAQVKANEDAIAAENARLLANSALANAAANTAALAQLQIDVMGRLPSSAVRRFTIQTPAVTLLVGTPLSFSVKIPTAFADGNYFVFFTKASGSVLLNVQLSDTNKLADSFTVTMQTTGIATVAVGSSSAEVFIIHA